MGGSLEERVARTEATLSQMDKRLNHLESDVSAFRREVRADISTFRGEVRADVSSLRDSINLLQRDKVDKWEVRIWFLILIALTTIITFLRG